VEKDRERGKKEKWEKYSNHVTIISRIIMRVNNGISTLGFSDVVNNGSESRFVSCVGGAGHSVGNNSFHEDWDSFLWC